MQKNFICKPIMEVQKQSRSKMNHRGVSCCRMKGFVQAEA